MSLNHFPGSAAPPASGRKRSVSPSKGSVGSGGKEKGKASAKNSDDEDEEDSGDEAEKLDEAQLNEIDSIYRK
jgi:DNA repair protein RAD5